MSNGSGMMMVMGGMMMIGAAVLVYFKGCSMGIKMFCKEEPLPPAPTLEQLYPRERTTTVMEYIANQAVEDIDANTFTQLGRNRKFELKSMLFDKYKRWMEEVAEFNDMRLAPMEGRALAKYSQMILDLCRRANISLNPAAEAQFRANLFAGTPSLGNITSNRVIIGW
jgi:hypothetical protein